MTPEQDALVASIEPRVRRWASWFTFRVRQSRTFMVHSEIVKDMEQAARLGACRAAQEYDESKSNGATFATYAFYWARSYMLDEWRQFNSVSSRFFGKECTDQAVRGIEDYVQAGPTVAPGTASDAAVLLASLKPRLRYIVQRTVLEGVTLKEVAEELHITTQRVHQLRAVALENMRKRIEHA